MKRATLLIPPILLALAAWRFEKLGERNHAYMVEDARLIANSKRSLPCVLIEKTAPYRTVEFCEWQGTGIVLSRNGQSVEVTTR